LWGRGIKHVMVHSHLESSRVHLIKGMEEIASSKNVIEAGCLVHHHVFRHIVIVRNSEGINRVDRLMVGKTMEVMALSLFIGFLFVSKQDDGIYLWPQRGGYSGV